MHDKKILRTIIFIIIPGEIKLCPFVAHDRSLKMSERQNNGGR